MEWQKMFYSKIHTGKRRESQHSFLANKNFYPNNFPGIMVRSLNPLHFRPPWPFIKKGSMGWRKIGPVKREKIVWPSQNREFPELNPKLYGKNPKELHSLFSII
jgi:hypothetical protein